MVGVPLESVGVPLESMIRLLIPDMHLVYGVKYHKELSTHDAHVVGVPLESVGGHSVQTSCPGFSCSPDTSIELNTVYYIYNIQTLIMS